MISPHKKSGLYEKLSKEKTSTTLGEWCKVGVGTVTGDNKYFIVDKRKQKKIRISNKWTKPIINRSAHLNGLLFTKNDLEYLCSNENIACQIIDTSIGSKIPIGLQRYLDKGISDGVNLAYKCQCRSPWHSVPILTAPDAFLLYMSAAHPKMILNQSHATCTNTIHTIHWSKNLNKKMIFSIALSLHSSYSHLSAELNGRSYGGGILKLEPSEASRLKLILPEKGFQNAISAGRKVDILLRKGLIDEATAMVDRIVLIEYLGLKHKDVKIFRDQIAFLKSRRNGN